MKNLSLQDQLLKAGLTNDAKAKKIRTDKRKQTKKQQKNKVEIVDEAKQLVQEAKAKRVEKDKKLNQQRNIEAEKKQIANQILQLIELNKLPKDEDGIVYNFTDQNIVKVIYISEDKRNKIIAGSLAIVKSRDNYEVVVAYGEPFGELNYRLKKAGVRTIKIGGLGRDINFLGEFGVAKKLWKILEDEKPDVIHLNSPKIGGLGGMLGRLIGIEKIIYTAHGWTFNEDRPLWQIFLILIYIFSTIHLSLSYHYFLILK